MSIYWAAGGSARVDTLGGSIVELALSRDPEFIALVWVTGALKVVAGLVALALVRPWRVTVPRRGLIVVARVLGAGMTAYGAIHLAASGLVTLLTRTGIINPESADWTGLLWHAVLWDPWWLLGGILFCVAALGYYRRSPGSVQAAELSSRAHYAQ
jgi:hypothetical protein